MEVAAEAVHNSTDQVRFEATYQVYRVTESPERHYHPGTKKYPVLG